MYYLDSCTCIELLRGKAPIAYKLMRRSDPRLFAIPSVVEAELRVGALKSQDPKGNGLLLERFLVPFAIVPFDSACAREYATIRAHLETAGMKIRPNDLMIAAMARCQNATFVTNNVREFKRVPGLRIESWCDVSLV